MAHKSPQRELGDCDVAHQSNNRHAQAGSYIRGGMGGVAGGVAFLPAVPGLAPWGFYG